MEAKDIRWEQRFCNFTKAQRKLEDAVNYIHENFLLDDKGKFDSVVNDLIKQGLIQSFEFTHELAWNVIRDYAAYQGNSEIRGSRDAVREGFSMGLIEKGDVWMEMIKSRNETSHTYEEQTASSIFNKIIFQYFPLFISFRDKMESIRSGNQGELFL